MNRFLRRFKLDLLGFSLQGAKAVGPEEPFSRFITSPRWVDSKTKKPKLQAFMPLTNGSFGTSVYRSSGTSVARLWRIGRAVADGTRDKILFGRAIITAEQITSVPDHPLSLKSGRLPSLHRDIAGWSGNKGNQKLVAGLLAIRSSFESTPGS
jgi:hypothetical protein